MRAIVSEVHSALKATATAKRHPSLGPLPRLALELTGNDDEGQPWDFDLPGQRAKAEKLIDAENPLLLICTQTCTVFSHLQNLNKAKICMRPRCTLYGGASCTGSTQTGAYHFA